MEKRLPLPVGTVLQGRYRIVRQLGHGGFGAVYEAVDDEINLAFALKETFYAADEELRQAFKREARMLASLSHDAFPRVSHYFTEGDGCFLVMELIRGDDLDKLLLKRAAPFEQDLVLTWADQLLDALEDLHASGIIHRDIKPSNLKLTPKGKIKLLDFGIAKGTLEGETTLLTTVGSLAAATLQYAPLEQVLKASPHYQMMLSVVYADRVAEIIGHGTDATSDLYALAATLYQLLTKQLPADAPTRALAVWSGQSDRLIPAHEANAQVKREVSEVLHKAMSLDRAERYQSAMGMRWMLREAIKPIAMIELAPKISGFDKTVKIPISDIPEIETITVSQPETTLLSNSPKSIDENKSKLSQSNNIQTKSFLKRRIAIVTSIILPLLLIIGLSVYFFTRDRFYKTLVGHNNSVSIVAFSPDGKTIASGATDKTINLWDFSTGESIQTIGKRETTSEIINTLTHSINSVIFSPDGKTLANVGNGPTLTLWDTSDGSLKQRLVRKHEGKEILNLGVWANSVAFSPDGKTIARDYNSQIELWDAINGSFLSEIGKGENRSGILDIANIHHDEIYSIAFSPDGQILASASADKAIILWNATTGNFKQRFTGHTDSVNSVSFSPDGRTICSGSSDKTIRLWEVVSGNLKQTLIGHSEKVTSVVFSPDGKTIASGSSDKTIKLWDVSSGTLKQTLTGHSSDVNSVAFSPDGKTLASGSSDKTIKLWRLE